MKIPQLLQFLTVSGLFALMSTTLRAEQGLTAIGIIQPETFAGTDQDNSTNVQQPTLPLFR